MTDYLLMIHTFNVVSLLNYVKILNMIFLYISHYSVLGYRYYINIRNKLYLNWMEEVFYV